MTNNLRFPGQYFDAETGLHYNWYRYYNSALGRYFRADPIGLEGGINPYVYADNGPIIKVDIKGLRFGFGFGVRFFIIGLSAERLWDTCCKDGKLIRRTIAKNCWSMGVGLSLKLSNKGFSPSLGGIKTNEGHCGQREWVVETEHKYGGDLVIYGRDSHSGNKWLPLALGGYYDIFQHCRYTIVSEKKVGCCSE